MDRAGTLLFPCEQGTVAKARPVTPRHARSRSKGEIALNHVSGRISK